MTRFNNPLGRTVSRTAGALTGLGILVGLACLASGQETPKPDRWQVSAEVSYVLTGGNAATSAFSLGNTFKREWAKDTLSIRTFMLRSNATTETRTAVGTETDYQLVVQKLERLVAENYLLAGQYGRRIARTVQAQAGLSWDRNRFAGVSGRTIFTAGLGWDMVQAKKTQLKSEAGITYTLRKYIGQKATSFGGLRVILSGAYKPMDKSSLTSNFILDDNLKNSVDWRFDWTNSITASITKSLALRTSLRLLYAHLPAEQAVPLFGPGGEETGLTVSVPLKKIDSFFTTSLVINF